MEPATGKSTNSGSRIGAGRPMFGGMGNGLRPLVSWWARQQALAKLDNRRIASHHSELEN
jgi:hypothetical protein